MNFFGIEFKYPLFLLLALIVPIFYLIEYRRKRIGVNFGNIDLLLKVYKRSSRFYYLEKYLVTVVILIFILILANPGVSNTYYEESKKGIDISIVLDISKSMLAEDITPNRLTAAKQVIDSFLTKIDSDRVSFVLFAGKPFIGVPLTFDYAALKAFVGNVTTDSINQIIPGLSGTAIGDAVISASDSLTTKGSENREKVIILITDGEANVGVKPKIAVKYVNDKKIKIYSIGIGKNEGTELFMSDSFGNKQYFVDSAGVPILAKLDEEILTYISDITKGKYYNAQSTDSLKNIFSELSKLNKSEIKVKSYKAFLPMYKEFLLVAIVMLILIFALKIYKSPKI